MSRSLSSSLAWRRPALGLAGTLAATLLSLGTAQAETQIEWWHAMGGALGEKVNEIADDFNASQDEYVVKPVFKGNYTEPMTSATAGR